MRPSALARIGFEQLEQMLAFGMVHWQRRWGLSQPYFARYHKQPRAMQTMADSRVWRKRSMDSRAWRAAAETRYYES